MNLYEEIEKIKTAGYNKQNGSTEGVHQKVHL